MKTIKAKATFFVRCPSCGHQMEQCSDHAISCGGKVTCSLHKKRFEKPFLLVELKETGPFIEPIRTGDEYNKLFIVKEIDKNGD